MIRILEFSIRFTEDNMHCFVDPFVPDKHVLICSVLVVEPEISLLSMGVLMRIKSVLLYTSMMI